jgi:hypothetical protein
MLVVRIWDAEDGLERQARLNRLRMGDPAHEGSPSSKSSSRMAQADRRMSSD